MASKNDMSIRHDACEQHNVAEFVQLPTAQTMIPMPNDVTVVDRTISIKHNK